jgi:hypothetical protein
VVRREGWSGEALPAARAWPQAGCETGASPRIDLLHLTAAHRRPPRPRFVWVRSGLHYSCSLFDAGDLWLVHQGANADADAAVAADTGAAGAPAAAAAVDDAAAGLDASKGAAEAAGSSEPAAAQDGSGGSSGGEENEGAPAAAGAADEER